MKPVAKIDELAGAVDAQAAPSRVMLVAGEVSGDEHAAELISALKQMKPGCEVFGMAGMHSREAGMETVVDSDEVGGAMGLTEVVSSIGGLVGAFRTLVREAKQRQPQLAILIDFPDFNMLLARFLHARGIKVFYFISPQLWAWRKGRVKTMKRYVRKIATIFPFEEAFYREHGVDAAYVGHPFLDRPPTPFDRKAFLEKNGIDPDRKIVGILPGSRESEVSRLLDVLVRGFAKLRAEHPELHAVVPVAPALSKNFVEAHLPKVDGLTLISGQASSVLRAASVSVVASGTATVEAALAGNPYIVVYRLSGFTYMVSRLLVRGVKNFAMVNVIAGREIVPEFLQDDVSEERIAKELGRLLFDEQAAGTMRTELQKVREQLRYSGTLAGTASERAASIAAQLMDEVGD
ncbi:MAG: lipid-A-disaccharide synthase [Bdellovibrionales bacterium]|nr:lipid-A-disaccharide synthase [Bdellovibrionales bacterium]